jgi:hypothetical protein
MARGLLREVDSGYRFILKNDPFSHTRCKYLFLRHLLHPDGLEPPTYSSVDCRSIQLSYGCFLLRTWTIGYNGVLARLKSEDWSNGRLRRRLSRRSSWALSLLYQCGFPYEVVIRSFDSYA